jgi:hypothetical protein
MSPFFLKRKLGTQTSPHGILNFFRPRSQPPITLPARTQSRLPDAARRTKSALIHAKATFVFSESGLAPLP